MSTVASTSKVPRANDVTHQNGSTTKRGAGGQVENKNSHSQSPEAKSILSKKSNANKTTKVSLASGGEKKQPRAKNDSFVSLGKEDPSFPRIK